MSIPFSASSASLRSILSPDPFAASARLWMVGIRAWPLRVRRHRSKRRRPASRRAGIAGGFPDLISRPPDHHRSTADDTRLVKPVHTRLPERHHRSAADNTRLVKSLHACSPEGHRRLRNMKDTAARNGGPYRDRQLTRSLTILTTSNAGTTRLKFVPSRSFTESARSAQPTGPRMTVAPRDSTVPAARACSSGASQVY